MEIEHQSPFLQVTTTDPTYRGLKENFRLPKRFLHSVTTTDPTYRGLKVTPPKAVICVMAVTTTDPTYRGLKDKHYFSISFLPALVTTTDPTYRGLKDGAVFVDLHAVVKLQPLTRLIGD